MADDLDYVRRLGEVLRQRDVAALRAFLEAQAARYGDERQVQAIHEQSDQELELILHRMILARSDLGDLHAESQRRLAPEGGSPGRQPRTRQGRQPGRTSAGQHVPGQRRRGQRPPGDDRSSNGRGA